MTAPLAPRYLSCQPSAGPVGNLRDNEDTRVREELGHTFRRGQLVKLTSHYFSFYVHMNILT